MEQIFRPAISLIILMTLLCGLAYPFAITGIAGLAFPAAAKGSLIERNGVVIGSSLIGQQFSTPRYFWPRPSATGETPYNGGASSGTNLGTTSAKLKAAVAAEASRLREMGISAPLPADAVTASGSGLDPHISPAYAALQLARVAKARGIEEARIATLVAAQTEGRTFGLIGEPRVNVLALNLALDSLQP